MKWLWKNKAHLLVLAVCAVYLLSASQIYAAFFLKGGKPQERLASLPAEKGEVKFSVEAVDAIYYDGEDLYELDGWVFDPAIADSPQFKKKVVLHSVSENLVYPAEIVKRNDLAKGLPMYINMDLTQAGFRILVAKDALKIGNYRIGFILEDEQGNVRAFRMVNAYLEREPNRLRLIHGQDQ